MKIPLPGGGYLELEEGPREGRFYRRILLVRLIPDTRVGYNCELECGHVVQAYGDLAHAGGVVLCTDCRDGVKIEEN